jgi:hypothetical protein
LFARVGERDAATVALQEYLTKFDLEGANVAAEHRLTYTQEFSGSAEASQFGHAREVLELS